MAFIIGIVLLNEKIHIFAINILTQYLVLFYHLSNRMSREVNMIFPSCVTTLFTEKTLYFPIFICCGNKFQILYYIRIREIKNVVTQEGKITQTSLTYHWKRIKFRIFLLLQTSLVSLKFWIYFHSKIQNIINNTSLRKYAEIPIASLKTLLNT